MDRHRPAPPSATLAALPSGVVVAILAAAAAAPPAAAAAEQLYWTDHVNGRIQRANLDGSGLADVITGLERPFALTADLPAGKLYWSEFGTATTPARIRRANLDGTGVQDLVTASAPGQVQHFDLTIDRAGGKLYWGERILLGPSSVRRSNLDGTQVEDVVADGQSGSALAFIDGRLYFETSNGSWVDSVLPDGSDRRSLYPSGSGGVYGIAHEPATGTFYLIDEDDNQIHVVYVHEDDGEAHFDPNLFSIYEYLQDDSYPWGLAIDPAGHRLYWSEGTTSAIHSYDYIDGQAALVLTLPDGGSPRRLIIVPEPAGLLPAGVVLLALARRRRRS